MTGALDCLDDRGLACTIMTCSVRQGEIDAYDLANERERGGEGPKRRLVQGSGWLWDTGVPRRLRNSSGVALVIYIRSTNQKMNSSTSVR